MRIEPTDVVLKDDAGKETRSTTTSSSRCSAARRRSTSSAAPASRSAASGQPTTCAGLRGFRSLLRLPLQLEGGRRPSTTTSRNTASSRTTSPKLSRDPVDVRRAPSRSRCGTPASTTRSPTAWPSSSSASAASAAPKTPYVTRCRRSSLTAIQLDAALPAAVPRPAAGSATTAVFDSGFGKTFADKLFPTADYGHGREYWRAFGFILAWPLFIWNVFSPKPLDVVARDRFVQTFVLIPLIIRRWGKGAYCGWICSCGALAETLGDAHRQKMPHGPIWNRVEHGRARSSWPLALPALRRARDLLDLAGHAGRARRAEVLRRAALGLDPSRRRAQLLPRWSTSSSPGSSASACTSGSPAASGAASPARSRRSCTSTRASRGSASSPRRRSASRATSARRSATRASTS